MSFSWKILRSIPCRVEANFIFLRTPLEPKWGMVCCLHFYKLAYFSKRTEKETQKGKMKNRKVPKSNDVKMSNPIIELFKNRKVQISKRCENVKCNNRIIQKSKVQICKRCEI